MSEYLWYDLETLGRDPRRSRIAQFGAIRTNADLDPVEDPIMFFCRPADDLLPSPGACLITGITPQQALAEGLHEAEFAARIFDEMTVSPATTASVSTTNSSATCSIALSSIPTNANGATATRAGI